MDRNVSLKQVETVGETFYLQIPVGFTKDIDGQDISSSTGIGLACETISRLVSFIIISILPIWYY